jgi:membrane-associated protein
MIDHLALLAASGGNLANASLAGASVHASVNILDAGSVIKAFGLAGIFAILFVQTGLLIGFFLPGDTLLALAGAFAALPTADSRHLPLAALLVGCPVAAIVGGEVGFLIGRRSVAMAKPGSTFEHSIRRIEPLFERFGEGWVVLVCRFIPVLRTFINPAAGMLKMSARRFAVWNAIGGIAWPVAFVLIGYYAGVKLHIEKYALPVVGIVVIASVLSILMELRRNRRRQAQGSA